MSRKKPGHVRIDVDVNEGILSVGDQCGRTRIPFDDFDFSVRGGAMPSFYKELADQVYRLRFRQAIKEVAEMRKAERCECLLRVLKTMTRKYLDDMPMQAQPPMESTTHYVEWT